MTTLRWCAALAVVAGAAFQVYVYHVRAQRFERDRDAGERIVHWPWYEYVDWYLKASTSLVGVAAILTDHPYLLTVYRHPAPLVGGLVVVAAGLALFTWSIWKLGAQYSPGHASYLPERLVTAGPYRYVRHPVYTSNMLMIVGMLIASGSLWLAPNPLILLAYYHVASRHEEVAIARRFPEYREYVRRTGRFLPRISGGHRDP